MSEASDASDTSFFLSIVYFVRHSVIEGNPWPRHRHKRHWQQNTTQKWKYKGVSLDGSKQMKGTIEANSRDQAVARITQMGAIPTELVNLSAGTGLNKSIELKGFAKLPSKKDFAVTSRQLATMVLQVSRSSAR